MGLIALSISGQKQDEIAHPLQILVEADFIEALDLTTMSGYDGQPTRLTYKRPRVPRYDPGWPGVALHQKDFEEFGGTGIKALFKIGEIYARQNLVERRSISHDPSARSVANLPCLVALSLRSAPRSGGRGCGIY